MEDSVKEDITAADNVTENASEMTEKNDVESSINTEKEDAAGEDELPQIDQDLEELRAEFPELAELESITGLNNPIRYAALRDLGLSPAEAYLLTSRRRVEYDNRSHLTSSVPASARSPRNGMSNRELEEMREIFGDVSDSEINKLYKKVTK